MFFGCRLRACSFAIAVGICPTQLQSQVETGSAFDVASIKPSNAEARLRMENLPGGRFTATAATVNVLVRHAFGVNDSQVSSTVKWTATDRFDIAAKAGGGQDRLSIEQSRRMLQQLLKDRFQVRIRKESKEMPVYSLTVSPNGSRLKPLLGEPATIRPSGRSQGLLRSTTTSGLASALTSFLGRIVIDETRLTGEYDISLEFTPEAALLQDPHGVSAFEAVQEQLGLKLVPRRAPVEMIVIEHAEKPTAN